MANNEQIQIYLRDIIEDFTIERNRNGLRGLWSSTRVKRQTRKLGGQFLNLDMPDGTSVIISHN